MKTNLEWMLVTVSWLGVVFNNQVALGETTQDSDSAYAYVEGSKEHFEEIQRGIIQLKNQSSDTATLELIELIKEWHKNTESYQQAMNKLHLLKSSLNHQNKTPTEADINNEIALRSQVITSIKERLKIGKRVISAYERSGKQQSWNQVLKVKCAFKYAPRGFTGDYKEKTATAEMDFSVQNRAMTNAVILGLHQIDQSLYHNLFLTAQTISDLRDHELDSDHVYKFGPYFTKQFNQPVISDITNPFYFAYHHLRNMRTKVCAKAYDKMQKDCKQYFWGCIADQQLSTPAMFEWKITA